MIGWGSGNCHGVVGHEEEVMELLWQNGQVVLKSQLSPRMPDDGTLHLIPAAAFRGASPAPSGDPPLQQQQEDANNNHHLFIQDDEMSSWLFSDFCSSLLLPAPSPSIPSRPPPAVPPPKRLDSFGHFSRTATAADQATVVASSDTPMVAGAADSTAQVSAQSTSPVVRVAATLDRTVTSSSGASSTSASASAELIPLVKSQEVGPPKTEARTPNERKRKSADGERSNDGEDVRLVSNHAKRVSSSTKRSRAAEVHNLSERRRRDRINEKMQALQQLIPHCNKADKASMLDEAIGYLKSLQMQVQMMSMGCAMMPVMYPGMQQYTPHMGVGMTRPMIPFPNIFNSSAPPTTAARPHMGPGLRFPTLQTPPHIPAPDLSTIPPTNYQPDSTLSSWSLLNSNSPRMPGFIVPYQQFFGLQHMHSPFQQSQANTSGSGKPTTSKVGKTLQKESPDCFFTPPKEAARAI